MKNNILFMAAGIALVFSLQSCKNNEADADGRNQYQIDSMVNARLLTLRDSVKMSCNELIMSAAQGRVDSLLAAGDKKADRKHTPKPEDKKDDGPVTGKKGTDGPPVTGKKGTDETKPKVTGKKGVEPK